ncbi:hypothetical protein [Leifsonia sp. Leaf264]|uniref:hypothetical protein n=1 Tax=Leifsonia sp. Leaf264 TaxID=1736314 RepID=UPI0006FEE86D|nr:hypothetical protein [Leifsonia sp. Leaf264]KQO98410.1 hypothetical protein ASF30_10135 [Leifsonia sp. Leaf264]
MSRDLSYYDRLSVGDRVVASRTIDGKLADRTIGTIVQIFRQMKGWDPQFKIKWDAVPKDEYTYYKRHELKLASEVNPVHGREKPVPPEYFRELLAYVDGFEIVDDVLIFTVKNGPKFAVEARAWEITDQAPIAAA